MILLSLSWQDSCPFPTQSLLVYRKKSITSSLLTFRSLTLAANRPLVFLSLHVCNKVHSTVQVNFFILLEFEDYHEILFIHVSNINIMSAGHYAVFAKFAVLTALRVPFTGI